MPEVEEADMPQVDRLLMQHLLRDHLQCDAVECEPTPWGTGATHWSQSFHISCHSRHLGTLFMVSTILPG